MRARLVRGCSKVEALQEPGASPGWLAACLLGGRTREKKKKSPPPPLLASSCVCCSAPPHQQALLSLGCCCTLADAQLRAERSVSGPAIPSANQGLHRRAGSCRWVGQKKKKKEENDCRTTCFSPPPPLPTPPPFRPPTLAPPTPRTDASPGTFLVCLSLPLSFCSRGSLRVFARPVISTGAFGSTDNTRRGARGAIPPPYPLMVNFHTHTPLPPHIHTPPPLPPPPPLLQNGQ